MSKIPVYICNRKKCLICKGAICGRTIDPDYAELDENGKDCKGCQWEGNESDFYPCSKCCNSYKNRYERKEE